MLKTNIFPYKWYLKDGIPAKGIQYNGLKVFSCFAGGGGSSMGYKLAGYNVLGFNEIDEKQADNYIKNLQPKYAYIEDIRTFVERKDLSKELYELDILDGSPPCTSFCMLGKREKTWGKLKKFNEGQTEQIIDTLSFDFINLTNKLKPKVMLFENVTGIIKGKAIKYINEIIIQLNKIGYITNKWILDSSFMDLPQKRQRIFIIGLRKDLLNKNIKIKGIFVPELNINLFFNHTQIPFSILEKEAKKIENNYSKYRNKIEKMQLLWENTKCDNNFQKAAEKLYNQKYFRFYRLSKNKPINTITTGANKDLFHYDICRNLTITELILASSFPLDYIFIPNTDKNIIYIMGMSVPPVMIANIANRLKSEIFDKL